MPRDRLYTIRRQAAEKRAQRAAFLATLVRIQVANEQLRAELASAAILRESYLHPIDVLRDEPEALRAPWWKFRS